MKFFSEEGFGTVHGMFSLDHLFFTIIGVCTIVILFLLTYKKSNQEINKIIKIIFFIVTILEILKIIWNFLVRDNIVLNNWVPLYFCSLFIYASGMYAFGKGIIKKIGLLWIVYGQLIGGIVFVFYPSSSIGIQPFFHVLTFHSLIYHVITAYVGIILIYKNINYLTFKDIKLYAITILSVELFVYLFNIIFDANMMFLNNPGVVSPLALVQKIFKSFYPLAVGIVQCFATFLMSFGIIKLLKYKIKNKDLRNT